MGMAVEVGLMLTAVFCGLQAMRAKQLLTAALWLAAVSAAVATAVYQLGAPEVAVVELSVGAGLVTILFVFAITIAGDEAMDAHPIVPRWVIWLLVLLAAGAVGSAIQPPVPGRLAGGEAAFTAVFWQERGLDLLLHIGLLFAGVLGILNLLTSDDTPSLPSTPPPDSAS